MTADYTAVTRGIEVGVQTFYLEEQSDPDAGTWVWAYRIRIENGGPETVQLLRRSWRITDAKGKLDLVEGPGVVGEQPVLRPGEVFEYTSGTPLQTPSGFMEGTYGMTIPETGEKFDAAVPAFSLDSPHVVRRLH